MNQIDAVCQTIEKTINQAVQKTLDQLEKDCDTICSTISGKLEADRLALLNEFSTVATHESLLVLLPPPPPPSSSQDIASSSDIESRCCPFLHAGTP